MDGPHGGWSPPVSCNDNSLNDRGQVSRPRQGPGQLAVVPGHNFKVSPLIRVHGVQIGARQLGSLFCCRGDSRWLTPETRNDYRKGTRMPVVGSKAADVFAFGMLRWRSSPVLYRLKNGRMRWSCSASRKGGDWGCRGTIRR